MPTSTYQHPLFGLIEFRSDHDHWVRGDHITFLSGFDSNDVIPVLIPQLVNVPGSHGGKLRFHRQGHTQLLRVFEEIAAEGLMHHIKKCEGTYNVRLRKPTSGALSKLPSEHAFGIAIDLNGDDPGFGASVAPVAHVFKRNGFLWGVEFNDPMHFQVQTFLP